MIKNHIRVTKYVSFQKNHHLTHSITGKKTARKFAPFSPNYCTFLSSINYLTKEISEKNIIILSTKTKNPFNLRNIFVHDLDNVAHDRRPGKRHVNVLTQKRRVIVETTQVQTAGFGIEAIAHHLLQET